MSRAWLVALVAISGASGLRAARAGEASPVAPLACTCNARYVVPEHELPVPTNAKVWVFGGPARTAELVADPRDTPSHAQVMSDGAPDGNATRFEPHLEPNRRYTFFADSHRWIVVNDDDAGSTRTEWKSTIVVGNDVDHDAPATPLSHSITIDWHAPAGNSVTRGADLAIDATFSPDTDLVRITFVTQDGRRTAVLTTPTRLRLCDVALPAPPDIAFPSRSPIVGVWLTALDLAGNESATVAIRYGVAGTSASACEDAYGKFFPTGENYILAIAVMLGGGLGVGFALMWLLRRGRYDAHAPADPVSLLVAERLVDGARRVHGLVCLAAIGVISAGLVTGAYWMLIVITLIGWNTDGYLKARRAAALLDNPVAGAELRGSRLTIVAHGSHASIVVSQRAVRAAKKRAVPDAAAL